MAAQHPGHPAVSEAKPPPLCEQCTKAYEEWANSEPVRLRRTVSLAGVGADDIIDIVNRAEPSWFIYPGHYVCDRPRVLADLKRLYRSQKEIICWRGVVHVGASWGVYEDTHQRDRENMGQYGRSLGAAVLFGDLDMLEKIEDMVYRAKGAELKAAGAGISA
jgi:hypothetical protein